MGLAASVPTAAQQADQDYASGPSDAINESLAQSVLPECASVLATPAYDEAGRLEEIKLQFRLNGETMTLLWLPLRDHDVVSKFVANLEAGKDATLGQGGRSQPALSAKGSNLVFLAPQLITHLPRALYAAPLVAALSLLIGK